MKSTSVFSIITPTLNRAGMISAAIESVLAQNYPHFEHIIVDGVSTDGTLELLKRYPHLKVQIGQDQGMYDALNKGLKLAKGEIIGFLNSDDLYAEDAFSVIAEKFQKQNILAVAGEALIFTIASNGESKIISNFSPEGASLLELSTIGSPYFNAWFFRRSVFEKIGNFRTNYKIVADREFMLRFALSALPYTTLNKPIYQYRQHMGSMTFEVTDQKLERIVNEHLYMTKTYLEQRSIPAEARELIRKLRTRDTLEMALRSLKKMNFPKFAYYSWQGFEYDPLWLLNFIRRVAHKKSI
ncbi:MAG: glycosyltransferase family 2 protein [Anaerolineales bacterium]